MTPELRCGISTSVSTPLEVCIRSGAVGGTLNAGDPVTVVVKSRFNLVPIVGGDSGFTTVKVLGRATMRMERPRPSSAADLGCTHEPRRDMRDERGAVMVIIAVMLPLLVILLSFVVDIGAWWVHKRHLQVQADASALAGVRYIQQFCSDAAVDSRGSEVLGRVERPAQPAAGRDGLGPRAYAGQLATLGQQRRHRHPNRRWTQTSPPREPQSALRRPQIRTGPAPARSVDVKMTESDLPWLVNFAQPSATPSASTGSSSRTRRRGSRSGHWPPRAGRCPWAFAIRRRGGRRRSSSTRASRRAIPRGSSGRRSSSTPA